MEYTIFVYGSLRKNMVNHHVLETFGATYVGFFTTLESYYMVGLKSGAYPYVLETRVHDSLVQGVVYGEVYNLDEKGIAYLDKLEGVPCQYVREKVWVKKNEGCILEVYMYILRNEVMIDSIAANFEKRYMAVEQNDWSIVVKN